MTTYAFIRPRDIGKGTEIIWTGTDPAEVAKRWREPDVRERPLRVLRDGEIAHASVAEAGAVFEAQADIELADLAASEAVQDAEDA